MAFGKDAPMSLQRTPVIKLHVGESWTDAWAKLAAAYGPVVTFLKGKKVYLDPAKRDALHDVYTGLLRSIKSNGIREPVDTLVNYLVLSTNRRYRLNAFLLGRLVLFDDLPVYARSAEVSRLHDPARIAIFREEIRLVKEEVSKLPLRQKKIVNLRTDGLRLVEAARAVGITPINARAAYHEAILTLRRRLKWAA